MKRIDVRGLVLVMVLVAGGVTTAHAQMNPLKGVIAMSEEELAAMGSAAAQLYTDPAATPGTVTEWRAPGGTAGSVELARTYEFEGMPCAHLRHMVKRAGTSDPQTFTIDRCRTTDGEWKIR